MISGGGQLTPTADTNGLGHCGTGTDACSASSEASDSAGHIGRALLAGGRMPFEGPACRQDCLKRPSGMGDPVRHVFLRAAQLDEVGTADSAGSPPGKQDPISAEGRPRASQSAAHRWLRRRADPVEPELSRQRRDNPTDRGRDWLTGSEPQARFQTCFSSASAIWPVWAAVRCPGKESPDRTVRVCIDLRARPGHRPFRQAGGPLPA